MSSSPAVPVLFLAGMGRSGSTLISRLLGQVPGVCSVGELNLWDRALAEDRTCGCGEVFSQCPFWTTVGEHAFSGWDRVDPAETESLRRSVERVRFVPALASGLTTPDFGDRLERYASLCARVYAGIRRASSADLIVDSSKYPSSAFIALRTPGIDLRIVHLVRTSPGVAHSWSKLVTRPERGKPMKQSTPGRSALNWDVYNGLLETLRFFDVPRIRVRYEDFVADPERELRRMLATGGLREDLELDFVDGHDVELRATHSVAGNPMRFRQGPERLRQDDAWSREMTPRARRLVTTLTWPGRVAYGYDSQGRPR